MFDITHHITRRFPLLERSSPMADGIELGFQFHRKLFQIPIHRQYNWTLVLSKMRHVPYPGLNELVCAVCWTGFRRRSNPAPVYKHSQTAYYRSPSRGVTNRPKLLPKRGHLRREVTLKPREISCHVIHAFLRPNDGNLLHFMTSFLVGLPIGSSP